MKTNHLFDSYVIYFAITHSEFVEIVVWFFYHFANLDSLSYCFLIFIVNVAHRMNQSCFRKGNITFCHFSNLSLVKFLTFLASRNCLVDTSMQVSCASDSITWVLSLNQEILKCVAQPLRQYSNVFRYVFEHLSQGFRI